MDNGPNSSAESGPKPRAAEPLYRLELSPGELLAILEHAKAALSAEEFAALQGAAPHRSLLCLDSRAGAETSSRNTARISQSHRPRRASLAVSTFPSSR